MLLLAPFGRSAAINERGCQPRSQGSLLPDLRSESLRGAVKKSQLFLTYISDCHHLSLLVSVQSCLITEYPGICSFFYPCWSHVSESEKLSSVEWEHLAAWNLKYNFLPGSERIGPFPFNKNSGLKFWKFDVPKVAQTRSKPPRAGWLLFL